MQTRQQVNVYYAVFDKAGDGGYNVFFPDFPGCVTFGETLQEAKKMAQEVLSLWIEELVDQRQQIPHSEERPIVEKIKISRTKKIKAM